MALKITVFFIACLIGLTLGQEESESEGPENKPCHHKGSWWKKHHFSPVPQCDKFHKDLHEQFKSNGQACKEACKEKPDDERRECFYGCKLEVAKDIERSPECCEKITAFYCSK